MQLEAVLYNSGCDCKQEIQEITKKMEQYIVSMNESIKEINDFYNVNDVKKEFSPALEIESVIRLLSAKVVFVGARTMQFVDDSIVMDGYRGVFAQICMILIDTMLDILRAWEISGGVVAIELFKKEEGVVLKISCSGDDKFESMSDSLGDVNSSVTEILTEKNIDAYVNIYSDKNGIVSEVIFKKAYID